MKKIATITLASLMLCNPLHIHGFAKDFLESNNVTRARIMLDPGILTLVDGTFFNADTLEMLVNYQNKIMDIMLGTKTKNGDRIGKYLFMGKKYGVYQLRDKENNKDALTSAQKNELYNLLNIAKDDLMALSEVFRDKVRGAKAIITSLIKESCEKRKRPNSVLTTWSNMKNPSYEEENKIFEKYVINFEDFVTFSTDLYNFLTDVINSCPKAQKQYRMRVLKFKKVKELLQNLLSTSTQKNIDKTAFLGHLKKKHLDKLTLEHITSEKVSALVTEFVNQKK